MRLYLLRLSVLWHMPKSEIMRKIKPCELLEMIAYDRVEPWSHNYKWYEPALVCATVANANRDPKHRPFEPKDFVPDWVAGTDSKKSKQQKLADKAGLLKMYVEMHNRKVEKK